MLQSLRDNLKGTVAVVVIIIFVVPLVLFGVEQLFVGSIGGNDVAEVNGEGIPVNDYRRALESEKSRRIEQFNLEADSPQLEEDVLRKPVLERLARAQALIQAAKDAGVGASKSILWPDVMAIEAFQVDGKFDKELFKERISFQGFTPGTFIDAVREDFLINVVRSGIASSSFLTAADVELIATITQQKRSFFTVTIPKEPFSDVEVSDEEMKEYYQQNQQRYIERETVVVDYLEISLDELAASVEVSDAQLKAAYEEEVKDFSPEPKYEIAHILLKEGDDQQQKVDEVKQALSSEKSFAELAKTYSEDLGSKSKGGELGELLVDVYPQNFVDAAMALQVGEVSPAVETDSGVHFIKLLNVKNVEPPSFEDRKDFIKKQLSRELAQSDYVNKMTLLEEKTFGQIPLADVAEELGLKLKTSPPFGRSGGPGISSNKEVSTAAYSDEVLKEGYNSAVLEIPGSKAVVIALKNHNPEKVKDFEVVKSAINSQLEREKVNAKVEAAAQELQASISSQEDAKSLAEEAGYEFELHEAASRSDFEINVSALRKAFALPRPSEEVPLVLDGASIPSGGYALVGLIEVIDGSVEDMEEAQLDAMKQQLSAQLGMSEYSNFEDNVYNSAEVKMPE